MALLDISQVTRSLQNLLREYILASSAWSGTLSVSISPPDRLTGDNTVGLYLYHLAENGSTKNLPAPSGNSPPIRYTPMGVDLFYQLTTHSDLQDEDTATEREQLMMGLAVKALRDFPTIDDSTVIINETAAPRERPVLHSELRGEDNRFRIVLQPVPPSEAVSYWTAGSSPLRLATYYQVAVILLEAEEPTSRAGRVLSYGIQTFVGGAPRLDGSENTLTFPVPGEEGERQLEARPAQVPVGGRVTFTGVNLTGDETHLLLWSRRWDGPQRAGTDWAVASPTAGRLAATVQETIGDQTVLPGMYAAQVAVVERRRLPDGSERAFEQTSNQTPFCITPRIDSFSPESPPDETSLVTASGYFFGREELVDLETLQVYVGADRLESTTDADPDRGQFRVEDEGTIELRLPEELPERLESGDRLPVRLLINGVESPPRWIIVP